MDYGCGPRRGGTASARRPCASGRGARTLSAERTPSMIFGMTTDTFVHVVVSLVGIVSGLVVLVGLLTAKRLGTWTAGFLATTAATSVTGLGFPFFRFLPSHAVRILSPRVLGPATLRPYPPRPAGPCVLICV